MTSLNASGDADNLDQWTKSLLVSTGMAMSCAQLNLARDLVSEVRAETGSMGVAEVVARWRVEPSLADLADKVAEKFFLDTPTAGRG